MLTEEQIETYLYKYVKKQEELTTYIIRTIIERVSDIGKLADFDNINSLEQAQRTTEDISKITKMVRKTQQEQIDQFEDDFLELMIILYAEAERYYEGQVLLQYNEALMNAYREFITEAADSFKELTQNPVIILRDMQNIGILKPYTIEQAYKSIIQEVAQYKQLNNIDMNIALNRTKTQLFNSGVRYISTDTIDSKKRATSGNTAVRFNVLESIKGFINKVQDIMGKQFGANGFELSAHIFPAPDHAPAQGHQFTKENVDKMQSGEDFEDVNGNHYDGFVRQIGTWNCRHYFMKIKLGAEPQYTQEQLDKILADNEKGYTTPDGKHYTLYECTQKQRQYEREIRKAKENYLFSKDLDDKLAMSRYRNRVGQLTTQYKQFSKACDIPAKLERIRVKYYI